MRALSILLTRNANIHTPGAAENLLHTACSVKHPNPAMVQMLLDYGMSVVTQTRWGGVRLKYFFILLSFGLFRSCVMWVAPHHAPMFAHNLCIGACSV